MLALYHDVGHERPMLIFIGPQIAAIASTVAGAVAAANKAKGIIPPPPTPAELRRRKRESVYLFLWMTMEWTLLLSIPALLVYLAFQIASRQ